MADNTIENAVGIRAEFRIGNTVIDLYPIRLKDWPDASKFMYILNFDSLADIAYVDGLVVLDSLVRIAARATELPDASNLGALSDMTDHEYKILKRLLGGQNDIDLDRLTDKISKMSGKPKNAQTPTSL